VGHVVLWKVKTFPFLILEKGRKERVSRIWQTRGGHCFKPNLFVQETSDQLLIHCSHDVVQSFPKLLTSASPIGQPKLFTNPKAFFNNPHLLLPELHIVPTC
jgi:hypothetical protein